MDQALKQRLIGAAIIIAVVVLVVPIFLEGPGERDGGSDIELPETPELERESRLLPLSEERPSPPEPVTRDVEPRPRAGEPIRSEPPERERVIEGPTEQTETQSEPVSEQNAGAESQAQTEQDSATPDQTRARPEEPEEPPVQEAEQEPAEVESPEPEGPELDGAFAVQVGAFGNEDNAMGLRDRIREGGFPAYVELYTGGSQAIYRVRVGPAVDQRAAEGLLQRLQAEMDLDGRVVSHP